MRKRSSSYGIQMMEIDDFQEPFLRPPSSTLDVTNMDWEDGSCVWNSTSELSPLNDLMNQSRFLSQNKNKNFFTGKNQKVTSPLSMSSLKISEHQKSIGHGLFNDFYCDNMLDWPKTPVVQHKSGWFTNGDDTCFYFQTTGLAYKRNWKAPSIQNNIPAIGQSEDHSASLPLMETSDTIDEQKDSDHPVKNKEVPSFQKAECINTSSRIDGYVEGNGEQSLLKDKRCFSKLLKAIVVIFMTLSIYAIFQLCTRGTIDVNSTNRNCDFKLLEETLKSDVYGQHLAVDIIINNLKAFFDSEKKLMVVSMHGPSGTGKTFVAQIVASILSWNRFLYFPVAKTFYHNSFDSNRENFRKEIDKVINPSLWASLYGKTSECSEFIVLDNMEYASKGLVKEVLKAIDIINNDRTFKQKAVFLLISNTGSDAINRNFVNSVTQQGMTRMSLGSDVFLTSHSFMEHLQDSWIREMLERKAIDSFVPFLPMENEHIQMCARHYIIQRIGSPSVDTVEMVLSQLERYHDQVEEFFSAFGCKKVLAKIDEVIFSSIS